MQRLALRDEKFSHLGARILGSVCSKDAAVASVGTAQVPFRPEPLIPPCVESVLEALAITAEAQSKNCSQAKEAASPNSWPLLRATHLE